MVFSSGILGRRFVAAGAIGALNVCGWRGAGCSFCMDEQRAGLPVDVGRSARRWLRGSLAPAVPSSRAVGHQQLGAYVSEALLQQRHHRVHVVAAGAQPVAEGQLGPQNSQRLSTAAQAAQQIVTPEDLALQDALRRLGFAAWVAERGRANAAKHAARAISSSIAQFKDEPAGVLAMKVLAVLDKGLLADHVGAGFVSETVSWPAVRCGCGGKLTLNLADACNAAAHSKDEFATVYGLAGQRDVLHLSRRCNCCNKRYYQTFRAERAPGTTVVQHTLCVKASAVNAIWWTGPGVGVDVALLRRMHLRFFRTHATFGGDASVAAMEEHGLQGDGNASQRHKRHCRLAWYQWRLALAQEAMAAAAPDAEAQSLLMPWEDIEATIAGMWPQYSTFWRRRWATNAADHHGGDEQRVAVLDAHQKGTRARCGTEACHELRSD